MFCIRSQEEVGPLSPCMALTWPKPLSPLDPHSDLSSLCLIF
jgi:hypothetical protein